jgi:hypothetical protein
MSVSNVVMFQCSNCNYSHTVNVAHASFDHTDKKVIAAPSGWWYGFDVEHQKLRVFCAAQPCKPERIAARVTLP